MQASRVVVVDKEPEYISNAQSWLENTRRSHPDFRDYNLVFVAGDMSHPGLVEATDTLEGNSFQLAYCHDVLYNMYSSPVALRVSVNTMARVVKPGGWVIAIEPKMGVEHVLEPSEVLRGFSIPVPQDECKDISQYFEAAGLIKFDLENAPECSYCYQKKS
jgi:ubiquinone/menaquinone biosynthesis C-methylase UbiE